MLTECIHNIETKIDPLHALFQLQRLFRWKIRNSNGIFHGKQINFRLQIATAEQV